MVMVKPGLSRTGIVDTSCHDVRRADAATSLRRNAQIKAPPRTADSTGGPRHDGIP